MEIIQENLYTCGYWGLKGRSNIICNHYLAIIVCMIVISTGPKIFFWSPMQFWRVLAMHEQTGMTTPVDLESTWISTLISKEIQLVDIYSITFWKRFDQVSDWNALKGSWLFFQSNIFVLFSWSSLSVNMILSLPWKMC